MVEELNIEDQDSFNADGGYNSDEGYVYMHKDFVERLSDPNTPTFRKAFMLTILVHELSHLGSDRAFQDMDGAGFHHGLGLHNASGHRLLILGEKYFSPFESFNEAVNQIATLRILQRYLEAQGEMRGEMERLVTRGETILTCPVYKYYIKLVRHIAKTVAKELDADEEDIVNSFVRAHYENPNILGDEMEDFFTKVFGEQFVDDFRKMGNESTKAEWKKFIDTYNTPKPSFVKDALQLVETVYRIKRGK